VQDTAAPLPLFPVLPGPGGLEIFFHFLNPFAVRGPGALAGTTLPRAHVVCIREGPLILDALGPLGFIAVRVRAGTGPRILGLPLTEVCDRPVSAEAIWGASAHELSQRIGEAGDTPSRVALLDRFFAARLRDNGRATAIDVAIARLHDDAAPIEALAQCVGLGRRQLEYRFREATGVSPARFRRLARLRRAVRAIVFAPPQASLTSLLDPGFADQAHAVHEFRSLTGMSPSEVRTRIARGSAHFYNPSRRG
jgi:AraC-like DNA-binding protein